PGSSSRRSPAPSGSSRSTRPPCSAKGRDMTFSIVARDAGGAFGLAVTSSSPCVAARCLHLRRDVGAVASQNITDPRYGKQLLDAMEQGTAPGEALDRLVAADATSAYRQISAIGVSGAPVAHSGEHTL